MKSIFTRPLFINPQAYLTIPELSYIQMATPFDFTKDSYSFVINTSGRIEGKLLKTSNDYILHLDLYSIDGNCVLGEFYLNNSELNTDNFNLTQSKNIITLQFGEQSSGNITYPGLIAAWSAKGKTNDDEDRAILKDLTGNGHNITLNGFTFSGMSGYGGYGTNFTIWGTTSDRVTAIISSKNIKISEFKNKKSAAFWNSSLLKKITVKIVGLQDGQSVKFGNDTISIIIKEVISDGIYKIDFTELGAKAKCIIGGFIGECNITIELLPEYPDALVFDGVDDFGINEDMPIINDYTLIVKRQWVKPLDTERVLISNGDAVTGLYATEIRRANSFGTIINFGNSIDVSDSYEKSGYYYNYDIIYQNANTYNGEIKLSKGSNNTSLKYFMIGRFRPSEYSRYFKGAFYSAYLFNRSLDEREIKAFIRKYIDPEYLLPQEIPTPDCYYDFSSGSNDDVDRNTIKDYSGNGNDAVAHNFGWNTEGSGYKDGALVFDGVDDYVSLDAFDSGFKTMFMVCKVHSNAQKILYDQRRVDANNNFAIFHSSQSIAYSERNPNKTFINGKNNTSILCNQLVGKKILININTDYVQKGGAITRIGSSYGNEYFVNMSLYKFLGFKEALTEEQIQAVIKKYNLLDGVDDIEVS